MSRTCNRAERAFSAVFDGSVDAADRAEFDRHLAACGSCRDAFSGFVRAMSDLASLRPTEPVSDAFVSQVMARVERAGTESNAGRISGVMAAPSRSPAHRFGTHFAAAVVGAAAALVLAPWIGARDARPAAVTGARVPVNPAPITPPTAAPRVQPAGLPIRFVGHSANIERNAKVETVEPTFTIRAGETLRSLPSQRVALTLEESGELVLQIESEESPAAPTAVNELTFVEVPSLVTVDRELVTAAVDDIERRVARGIAEIDFGASVSSVSELLRTAARRARELRMESAAPAVSTPADATPTTTDPVATDTGANPALTDGSPFAADTSPVFIQSSGEQTRLAVQGPLEQVVPELISLLADSDVDVADLAETRLDTIRRELEADPRLGALLSPLPPSVERADSSGPARLGRWLRNPFASAEPIDRVVPRLERWRRWWSANALVVATGHPTNDV